MRQPPLSLSGCKKWALSVRSLKPCSALQFCSGVAHTVCHELSSLGLGGLLAPGDLLEPAPAGEVICNGEAIDDTTSTRDKRVGHSGQCAHGAAASCTDCE
jgi:hypothetical protein